MDTWNKSYGFVGNVPLGVSGYVFKVEGEGEQGEKLKQTKIFNCVVVFQAVTLPIYIVTQQQNQPSLTTALCSESFLNGRAYTHSSCFVKRPGCQQ